MRQILTIILAFMAFTTISARSKSTKDTPVEVGRIYIYGVSISPTDSVVYMTDLLFIENAQLTRRNRFLVNRKGYSNQLRDHMASHGLPARTCSVSFNKSLKAIDQDYQKQVKAFRKQGYTIKNVNQMAFRFQTVRTEE